MYFTNGSSRAFEMLMRGKPGFDRYESGSIPRQEVKTHKLRTIPGIPPEHLTILRAAHSLLGVSAPRSAVVK
mgnify:FL=1